VADAEKIKILPKILEEGKQRAAHWLSAEMARPNSCFAVPFIKNYRRGIEHCNTPGTCSGPDFGRRNGEA